MRKYRFLSASLVVALLFVVAISFVFIQHHLPEDDISEDGIAILGVRIEAWGVLFGMWSSVLGGLAVCVAVWSVILTARTFVAERRPWLLMEIQEDNWEVVEWTFGSRSAKIKLPCIRLCNAGQSPALRVVFHTEVQWWPTADNYLEDALDVFANKMRRSYAGPAASRTLIILPGSECILEDVVCRSPSDFIDPGAAYGYGFDIIYGVSYFGPDGAEMYHHAVSKYLNFNFPDSTDGFVEYAPQEKLRGERHSVG